MVTLVIGGARSGKSAYAEREIEKTEALQRIYIATLDPGEDEEMHERIARHQSTRAGKGYQTMECPMRLADVSVPKNSVVLVECLSTLLANEMFGEGGAGEQAVHSILDGVTRLCDSASDIYFIANNVFDDISHPSESVEGYRHELMVLATEVAKRADRVVEMVCGIPLVLKGNMVAGEQTG